MISVNPYKPLYQMYSEDTIKRFGEHSESQSTPHVFALSRDAYLSMRRNDRSQAILVR